MQILPPKTLHYLDPALGGILLLWPRDDNLPDQWHDHALIVLQWFVVIRLGPIHALHLAYCHMSLSHGPRGDCLCYHTGTCSLDSPQEGS